MSSSRATSFAIGATFFFLPLSKSFTYLALLIAIVSLVATGAVRDELRQRRFPAWMWAAAVLAILPLASLLVHDDPAASRDQLSLSYYWIIAFVVYVAAARLSITNWLRAFVAGTVACVAYLQLKLLGLPAFAGEPLAVGNYILYSQFLALGVVVVSLLHRQEARRHVRTLHWLALAVMLYGLVTGSGRTGLVTILVLAPFIVSNLLGNRRTWMVVAGCAIAAALVLSSQTVRTRIQHAVQDVEKWQAAESRTSLGYRVQMWRIAGAIVADRPVTGGGPDAFRKVWHDRVRTSDENFVEPHNAYVFYASAYGIPGLLALVVLYASLCWTGWRDRRSLAGGLTFAFAVICILGSVTNTMFMGTASRMMLMIFFGLQGHMRYRAQPPDPVAGRP
jgi:O-antigen ligase